MTLWLRDFDPAIPPAAHIVQPRFESALALVRAGYEDLISLRDRLSPATHLIFHTYDFAIPDGRGVCSLGPWLRPSLDSRGFPRTGNAARETVKAMLVQFSSMLNGLAAGRPDITVLATQGTLAPVTSSWHNELHPSKDGFNRMAAIFHAKLVSLFPGRVAR